MAIVYETRDMHLNSNKASAVDEVRTESPHTTLADSRCEFLLRQGFDPRMWLDQNLVVGLVANRAYLVDIRKTVFDNDFLNYLGSSPVFDMSNEICIDVEEVECEDPEDGRTFNGLRFIFIDERFDFNSEPVLDVIFSR